MVLTAIVVEHITEHGRLMCVRERGRVGRGGDREESERRGMIRERRELGGRGSESESEEMSRNRADERGELNEERIKYEGKQSSS